MTTLKVNEWYYTKFETRFCCGEQEHIVYCFAHDTAQECGFCSANHYEPCECE